MQERSLIYRCDAVCDAVGVSSRPGEVEVRGDRIVRAGGVRAEIGGAEVVQVSGLVMPALVNAHAHLELTSIGPQPYAGDFPDWVLMLHELRPTGADQVFESARCGARQSLEGGVATIGDVGSARRGHRAPMQAMAEEGMAGVSFHELIGLGGEPAALALQLLEEIGRAVKSDVSVRSGLQPHAPYSTSHDLYRAVTDVAIDFGLPLTTHLAEMTEEAEFVATAGGRFRAFLEAIEKWDDAYAAGYCHGLTPVQWMRPHLERARWLLAHCNYVSDEDIAILAETGASVAYCPLASEYFGHSGHRYREMLAAGVNVCLGTDSIVCQPADEAQPMSMLPQMRRLFLRDRVDARMVLAMATTHGMRALGFDPHDATLSSGAPARLIAADFDTRDARDPLTQILSSRYPVRTVTIQQSEGTS